MKWIRYTCLSKKDSTKDCEESSAQEIQEYNYSELSAIYLNELWKYCPFIFICKSQIRVYFQKNDN